MIQQRKKSAQRSFTGLAGSPLSRVSDTAPRVDPTTQAQANVTSLIDAVSQATTDKQVKEVVRVKMGRPPKFGAAMTAAERKRLSRQKRRDIARRDLIAKLMEIFRRQQSTVVNTRDVHGALNDHATEAERHGQDRARMNQHLNALHTLTLAELQQALAVQTARPDSHGRSRYETKTGGRSHVDLANLQAQVQHNVNLIEEESDQWKNLGGRFKVKPNGAGPDED